MTLGPADRVAAVVVTYRRPDLLLRTLERVAGQTTPVDTVLVVDNDDDEVLERQVHAQHPDVVYLRSTSNLGPGGAFAVGLGHLVEHHDAAWYWTLDDDSPPALDALRQALDVATSTSPQPGAVSLRGGHIVGGRIRHTLGAQSVPTPQLADFVLVDGAVLSARAVQAAGFPRTDFFIMMEDLEYTMRIRRAGFSLVVRPGDGSENLYRGSGAPWRGYYQARNHLRMAIELRSASLARGWVARELAINANHMNGGRWHHIRFRLRGAVDAMAGRMGRRVEPTAG